MTDIRRTTEAEDANGHPTCSQCRHWTLIRVGLYPNWATYCSRIRPERAAHPFDYCDLYEFGECVSQDLTLPARAPRDAPSPPPH